MGDTSWFNITSLVNLQKGLINDLSGNNDAAATRAVNTLNSNLLSLSNTINSSTATLLSILRFITSLPLYKVIFPTPLPT